jgi:hypothetical protein
MSEQKKRIILAIVLASVAIILLGGVSLSLFPAQQTQKSNSEPGPILQNPNQPLASGESGNLELTMTVDKTAYGLGEPVNITLTLTNISSQTINFTHTGLDFDFQVYNGTNNVVYQWSNFQFIPQFITIEPLPAGGSISANFTWMQTCNFNAQVQGDPVTPGTYNIIGQTGPTYGIQTTPILITINSGVDSNA